MASLGQRIDNLNVHCKDGVVHWFAVRVEIARRDGVLSVTESNDDGSRRVVSFSTDQIAYVETFYLPPD